MSKPVKVKDAPGLAWKSRKDGWEARWQCRTDLVKLGFKIKSERLWCGSGEPTEIEWNAISDRCRQLQSEMLVFGRGGLPMVQSFDGTLRSLMDSYKTDADSTYRNLRYKARLNYNAIMSLIEREHGDVHLSEIKGRTLRHWHDAWSAAGHFAVAHGKIGLLRTLFGFGATMLEDGECERLSGVLHQMRFKMPKARVERLTAEQAVAIRAKAHEIGRPSIALAQAFQFEGMLRQKDVIGEWVPISEPGATDVTREGWKWLRGIRWSEIDDNLILRHVTSKRQKEVEINLKNAPMVMEELAKLGERPASGPVIRSEWDGVPYEAPEFRRQWRILANACGIPKSVKNMDTRAGAISEALLAGAPLDSVRKSATHSNSAMTQRYSRGDAEASAEVAQFRLAHRNKNGTK